MTDIAIPSTFLSPAAGALRRFWRTARGFWHGSRAWSLIALLAVCVVLQLVVQYRLNLWNRDFFDALEAHNGGQIWHQARLLMVFAALKLTVALLILKWMPLRLALTPGATKHRRVRRRAVAIYQAAAAGRTAGKTGILIYLSLAERRAEIVADEAIHKLTDEHTWGEAMAALISDVREGRPGDGICAAIERVGGVLAVHFPRPATDSNEIPDKLIEL